MKTTHEDDPKDTSLFTGYLRDLITEKVLPIINVLSWLRLRRYILRNPVAVIGEDLSEFPDWKGPVRFAIKGITYQLAAINALTLSAAYIFDPSRIEDIYRVVKSTTNLYAYIIPVTVFVNSYTFRWILASQPSLLDASPKPDVVLHSHAIYMTFFLSACIIPTTVHSIAIQYMSVVGADEAMGFTLLASAWLTVTGTYAGIRMHKILPCTISETFIAIVGSNILTTIVIFLCVVLFYAAFGI